MRSRHPWIALLAVVAAGVVIPRTVVAQDDRECSRWTPWSPVHPLSVTWSWRMCPSPSGRYDIQWRFSNLSPDDIEFRYQLFTGHVMQCGDRSRGQVFASGRVKLRGGQEQQRYHGRKWLRQSGFDGSRFVLYLCVRPES